MVVSGWRKETCSIWSILVFPNCLEIQLFVMEYNLGQKKKKNHFSLYVKEGKEEGVFQQNYFDYYFLFACFWGRVSFIIGQTRAYG